MSILESRTEMDLQKNDKGQVVGPCNHCDKWGHNHVRKRVTHDNGTFSYNYYCPEE